MPRPPATPPRTGAARSRLRLRRGLLLSALPIVVAIAAAGIVLAVTHRNAAVQDRRDETAALAGAAANNASRFVRDQLTILQTIALAPAVQARDYDAMRTYLQRVSKRPSFSTSVFFVDRRGVIQATESSDGVSLADRAYVQGALRGSPTFSDVIVARVSKSPSLSVAYPVTRRVGSRPIGAVVANLRLNEVSSALNRLFYAPKAREFLLDQQGHLILADTPVQRLQDPPASIRRTREVTTRIGRVGGERRLIGLAPVPATGWTAAVHVAYGSTIQPLNTALLAEIAALVVLALLGVLATLTAARRLERIELERDEALEEQSEIAIQLQRSMLPALVRPDGVDLEARYVPAQGGLSVGGDWYDLVELEDGRIALSVGDVAGHGLAAAVVMGKLRSAARSLALSGRGPGPALTELDRFTARVDGRPLATVVHALLDPATGELRYACAGHPPPLLVRAGGDAAFLEAGRSPLLGIAPGEARAEGAEHLEPGDTLLLYTDGLIERPGSSIDAGMDGLRALAMELGPDPERLARGLLAAVGEPRRDDVAILCLRLAGARRPQPSVAS